MRTFPTSIQGELNKRLGVEPLLILGVEWSDGQEVLYSDRKIDNADYPYPFLLSLGAFDTSTVVSGGSDTQSTSIVLNDIDGSLKQITNTIDIHKRKASIYLCFNGLPVTEKVLLFSGQINSPITWDEGARTLGFDILSKIEDTEVAFTMEDSQYFPYVPPSDRGKVWPLVFGEVCHMQGVPVTALRKGFMAEGVGVMDPTIDQRLCQANKLKCAAQPADPNDPTSKPQIDQSCVTRRFNEICGILFDKAQQQQYVKTHFQIRGGAQFPQNQSIQITVNGVVFTGVMVGENFTVTNVHHPDLDEIHNPVCKDIKDSSNGFRNNPNSSTFWTINGKGDTATYTGPALTSSLQCKDGSGLSPTQTLVDGAGASWDYYETFEKSHFIWLPPGANVFLTSEAEIINIVSLIPGVVLEVAAYRTFGDTSLLIEVPTELYTVHNVDYEGYQQVVEVRLAKKLSLIPDENWDDDIYISFESSVGPSPVDAITYLVGKYTNLTIDAVSFASVKSSLAKYPANFYIKDKKSVLELIQDIAYQFRCAVSVRNNVISLVYLAKEPSSLKTLTESDIVANSFQVTFTSTEDLVTRHELTWSPTDAPVNKDDDVDLTFVLKQNVPKYGVASQSYEYFTQNTFETVLKSATFWMIRQCNTWKYVEFSTPIKHLDLEIFDCVTLNIAQFPGTKVVIQETHYDADSNTIKFKCWTPILSGTNTEYYWAWPALKAAHAIFPLIGANQSGDGYEFIVRPPVGHPLYGGYSEDTAQVWTDGDIHPSDLDDTIPIPECNLATDATLAEQLEPTIEPFEPLANQQFNQRQNNIAGQPQTGGGGSNKDKEEKSACGAHSGTAMGCEYEVTVQYCTPILVGHNGSCEGPCQGSPGQKGGVCAGGLTPFCHTFGALWAAQAFASSMAASIERCSGGNPKGTVGQSAPYSVGNVKAFPCDVCGSLGTCDSPTGAGDPNAAMAKSGQTFAPKQGKTV